MGGGSYSSSRRTVRAQNMGYYTNSLAQTFTSNSITFDDLARDDSMNPKNITIRESRDSEEHPNSVAILLGLDVTGSMGRVPGHIVKDGLPTIMDAMIRDGGVLDPQVLFVGIGDHKCDHAPLQVGQFESSDELLDKWLTDIYLEGHGGGNGGESYALAWYFASQHTAIDCFEKRNIKGFIFTIGDEDYHRTIPISSLREIMSHASGEVNLSSEALLNAAKEKYNVFHIHLLDGTGNKPNIIESWRNLLGENLITTENYEEIPQLIVSKINEFSQEILEAERHVTRRRLDI